MWVDATAGEAGKAAQRALVQTWPRDGTQRSSSVPRAPGFPGAPVWGAADRLES